MPISVAILGGGPAGLTLGRLLELSGIQYTIFERDESASWVHSHSGSGTLDIRAGTGQLALEKAGLTAQFNALARHNVPTKVADRSGNLYIDVVSEGEDDQPEIDRKDLRSMLLRSIPKERVRWNMKVQKVLKEEDGAVSMLFANGEHISGFDLVVGADGAWSKVRELVTPSKPQYQGVTFLTTTLSVSSPYYSTAQSMVSTGLYIALGGSKGLIIVKLGDDSYYVGVGMRLPEDWKTKNAKLLENAVATRAYLKNLFNDWPDKHTDFIKHSDGTYHLWPQYSLEPENLDWAPVSGVTLIGDAAHLTVADGQGVNSAMYDAYCLAEQILNVGTINLDAAIAAYQEQMLLRSGTRLYKSIPGLQHMYSSSAPQSYIGFLTE